jgi:membrane-associated phospholipid phosphatase
VKEITLSALGAITLIVLSIQLVDLPLATWIAEYVGTYLPYVRTANIQDQLLIIVVTLTSLSWMVYFYFAYQNIFDRRTFFCRISGTVLPISFGLKTILKWMFGRTETHTWLSDNSQYSFHWFAGTKGFQGFPSGHMLVFTPVFLALWHFYPRYRLYFGALWLCLGAALITTEYHFLSDVLAGVYIGMLVYLAVNRMIGNEPD